MENLDDYLEGKLSPEDMEKTTQQLIRGKLAADKKKEWGAVLEQKQGISRSTKPQKAKIRRLPLWLSAAAAAVLLLLSIPIFNILNPDTSAIALVEQQLTTPFPNNESRKGETGFEELKNRAIAAYNTGNYAKAIAAYEQIVDQNKAKEEELFFLGLSYLYQKNGDVSKAIQYFQSAKSSGTTKYIEEINWFLSLAWIKNGNEENASIELAKIVEKQGWKSKEAKAILESLSF